MVIRMRKKWSKFGACAGNETGPTAVRPYHSRRHTRRPSTHTHERTLFLPPTFSYRTGTALKVNRDRSPYSCPIPRKSSSRTVTEMISSSALRASDVRPTAIRYRHYRTIGHLSDAKYCRYMHVTMSLGFLHVCRLANHQPGYRRKPTRKMRGLTSTSCSS